MWQKAMILTKRSLDNQRRLSTMWLNIIVICATGPPILTKPRNKKYRNTSRHDGIRSPELELFCGVCFIGVAKMRVAHRSTESLAAKFLRRATLLWPNLSAPDQYRSLPLAEISHRPSRRRGS